MKVHPNATRRKQKHVQCEKCGWRTKRSYSSDRHSFGICCNDSCKGLMRKILSAKELKFEQIRKEMSQI